MVCTYWLYISGWIEHVLCELQQAITLVRLNCIYAAQFILYEMPADERHQTSNMFSLSLYMVCVRVCMLSCIWFSQAYICVCASWAKESRRNILLTSERGRESWLYFAVTMSATGSIYVCCVHNIEACLIYMLHCYMVFSLFWLFLQIELNIDINRSRYS